MDVDRRTRNDRRSGFDRRQSVGGWNGPERRAAATRRTGAERRHRPNARH